MPETKFTAGEIAGKIGGEVIGDAGQTVSGISDLKGARAQDLSFVLAPKYKKPAEASAARILIADAGIDLPGRTVIRVKNARLAYVAAIALFYPAKQRRAFVSPDAVVDASAVLGSNVEISPGAVVGAKAALGDGVFIGPGAVIGAGAVVGANTVINANAVLYDGVTVGGNCIIHSGVVIGADGFGFVPDGNNLVKVPQVGSVTIGNNVEIGANSCIDRAAFGHTVIHDNVKIDNLVQVAHNVEIGDSTIVVAQAGIAGSSKIGKGCIIGGQVGIVDHVNIGDGAKLGSQAGVPGDVEPGAMLTGTPARPVVALRKAEAYMMKLEELFKRVKALEEELKKKQ